jgi:flagellar basal-body rod protein FlgB
MFNNLEILGLAQARAQHAAARQVQVATNIANADTPGYRARDVAPFEQVFRAQGGDPRDHLNIRIIDAGGPESPNGNTVSLEAEMVRSVEAQRDHERALSVYRSAMNVLRAGLGR